jgi:hypothetical protein
MSKNTSARGQIDRALNIAKGIVAQEALRGEFESKGIRVELQRKSHRDEDLFDFRLKLGGAAKRFDVKSIAYYNNYPDVGRPPFSKQLIFDNRAYPGPDWRRFFPMLVPHTQIHQEKEAYIFLISESGDFRKQVLEGHSKHLIAAFPYGDSMPFYTYKKLCAAREASKKGFYIYLEYNADGLFAKKDKLDVRVLFEWAGENKDVTVTLADGVKSKVIGPISVLNCISLTAEHFQQFAGTISLWLAKNECSAFVPNSKMQNINEEPDEALVYTKADFCNLMLPDQYKVHCIGFIPKSEFIEACKQYPAWVWPIDKIDRFSNTAWTQITERDRELLDSLGLGGQISKNPAKINFGLMKTSGRGPGACCYVFPNLFGTGVRETNLYVLPKDLYDISSIGS